MQGTTSFAASPQHAPIDMNVDMTEIEDLSDFENNKADIDEASSIENYSGNKSKMHRDKLPTSKNLLSMINSFVPRFMRSSKQNLPQLEHRQLEGETSNSTLTVIHALAKFQACLLVLSNTVVRLQESLKLISIAPPLTMSTALGGPFKLEDIPVDNNNVLKGVPDSSIPDTVLSLSSSSTSPSLDTVTTDVTGFSVHYNNLSQHKEPVSMTIVSEKQPHRPSCFSIVLSKIFKYVGIFLALFASICMSLVTLVVKYMDNYHPVSKVIWRLQGVLLPSFLIVLYVKYYKKQALIVWKDSEKEKLTKNWKLKLGLLLFVRGLVGCSADIFQYYSLKYLPLADSTVISFSTPIFVCLVAHYMLGERCGVVPFCSTVLTFLGVVIIANPPILNGNKPMSNPILIGNALAFACMFCATFTTVILRSLKHVHFAMTMLALGVVGTLEGLVATIFTGPFEFPKISSSNYIDLTMAALIACLFFFGQLAQTLALSYEEAGVVSLVRTCDVMFAFIWQVNLLQQNAPLRSYIGAIVVTVGVVITGLRKWVNDLPENRNLRKRLSFILR